MKALCIYHGSCDDGFAAAWAVRRALGDDVEFWPGVYQKDPPWHLLDGRGVFLVDFSYKRPVLERMLDRVSQLTILDHHATAEEELSPLMAGGIDSPVLGKFDMRQSGSMITWKWFHEEPPPKLFAYIEDRDLWRKALPDGDRVIMALRSYPQDFAVWDELMNDNELDRLRLEGEAIHRWYRHQVDILKNGYVRWVAFNGLMGGDYVVPAVNCPPMFASEIAGELAAEHGTPFALCYWDTPTRTTLSFRSRGPFHVGKLAENWGGGGHAGAAGCAVERDFLQFVPAPQPQP